MGINCLLIALVMGYKRVPDPPARMIPFMRVEVIVERVERVEVNVERVEVIVEKVEKVEIYFLKDLISLSGIAKGIYFERQLLNCRTICCQLLNVYVFKFRSNNKIVQYFYGTTVGD